jgi:hypothetical protein
MTRLNRSANISVTPGGVQQESRLRISSERPAALAHAIYLAGSLKRAVHATIHRSTQGAKAIAEHAGISYQFLVNSALDSTPDQLPFARVPLVLEACDDLSLLQFLAYCQGCEVVRLPRVSVEREDVRRTSQAMHEFAEFMDATAAALDDGVVEIEELEKLDREGHEAIRAILQLIADYRARVKRPLLEGLR